MYIIDNLWRALARKGESITLRDFDWFDGKDIGSGFSLILALLLKNTTILLIT
jgi:hypothetical protein